MMIHQIINNARKLTPRLLAWVVAFVLVFSPATAAAQEVSASETPETASTTAQTLPDDSVPNFLLTYFEPYPTYLLDIEGQEVLIDYLGFLYSHSSDTFIPIWAYDECFNHAYQNGLSLKSCDPTVEHNIENYTHPQ